MPTITADDTPRFPRCPAYGFTVEPQILTVHVGTQAGREKSARLWADPLRRFTAVPMGEQADDDIHEVLHFWLAIGGQSGRFRFTDWTDASSAPVLDDAETELDQPLIEDGSPGWTLYKNYTAGSLVYQRPVTRPVGSTILVANDSGVLQSDWTLDEATGVLMPGGGFAGTPATWGGAFDVYCRFESELPIEMTNYKIMATSFTLREVRP